MSRIGKKPIEIPSGVKVELKNNNCCVSGPLGELNIQCNPAVIVKIEDNQIVIINEKPTVRFNRQMHGTTRALIANMVAGVSKGYAKKMQIFGTGYNIKEQNGKLVLQVGFCHPVEMPIPKGLKLEIEVPATRGNDIPAKFAITGSDKCQMGQFAAEVRKVRPPEPYKGKGIRYADEVVRRKVGKAFASGGA